MNLGPFHATPSATTININRINPASLMENSNTTLMLLDLPQHSSYHAVKNKARLEGRLRGNGPNNQTQHHRDERGSDEERAEGETSPPWNPGHKSHRAR
jgi:hypothetical protein